MNAFLSTAVLLTALTQSSNSPATQPFSLESSSRTVQQQSAPSQNVAAQQALDALFSPSAAILGEQPSWERARETVLVIPTPDLPAENREQLTEDLAVMCRIFDKSLLPARFRLRTSASTGQALNYILGQETATTQGLYLDGYGVLFFLQVDYPLVPTQQQEQQPPQAQEQGDPVWSQTIQEMTGRQGDRSETGASGETYDPQKVEGLKRTLIKTLAHAANIRTPRPQDLITLVVGPLDDKTGYYYYRTSTGLSAGLSTPGAARSSRRNSLSGSVWPETGPAPAPAGVMVMHVAKSDVDAFAKGQLPLPQFTEKVQTLWSWPSGIVSKDNQPPVVPAPPAAR